MRRTNNNTKYRIVLEGTENTNPFEELIKIFLRPDQYTITNKITETEDEAHSDDPSGHEGENSTSREKLDEETLDEEILNEETLFFRVSEDKDITRRQIFECLSAKTGIRPKWGIMTGIRPVKLYGMLTEEFAGDDDGNERISAVDNTISRVKQQFREHYLVSEEKTELTAEMFAYQREIFGEADDHSCGIYIGIPFCPTRCLYCSFASNPADEEKIKKYLEALHREIEFCGAAMKEKGLYGESIYIGGGTPTTLSAGQLDELLHHVTDVIPVQHVTNANNASSNVNTAGSGLKEFTVEAGRPDTITSDKIKAMLSNGVGRISINPQTMNRETLKTIGRDHTPEDVRKAFETVRRAEEEYWQQNGAADAADKDSDPKQDGSCRKSCLHKLIINTDLIAGLPGEDVPDMENSIREMIDLGADNITVHSLAVKRASRLSEEDKDYHYSRGEVVSRMLERAQEMLRESAYIPYYLYRQKHMSGAQENTGYCKEGTASIYNVRIMDEHQRIIAMGAGGISKAYDPVTKTLERVPNVTNQEIYTDRIDEMIRRKKDKLFL